MSKKSYFYKPSNEDLESSLRAKLLKARYVENNTIVEETLLKLKSLRDGSTG